ncbi:hypothetical protein ABWK43_29925 [Bacillus thuringiensis]|uniref:hypothetical protein n=1 Tax=Bacillus thuringiensis TaxID=1428 RepID=UPI00339514A1
MSKELFAIIFPILILMAYIGIKFLVDNKNHTFILLHEIYSFPMDILFLGIAYLGGILVLNFEITLLGIIILLGTLIFAACLKYSINLSLRIPEKRRALGHFLCFLNYVLSIIIVAIIALVQLKITLK